MNITDIKVLQNKISYSLSNCKLSDKCCNNKKKKNVEEKIIKKTSFFRRITCFLFLLLFGLCSTTYLLLLYLAIVYPNTYSLYTNETTSAIIFETK